MCFDLNQRIRCILDYRSPRAPAERADAGKNVSSGEVEYLERRRKAMQDEITKARLQNPPDELTISDLKARKLHLEDEIDGVIRKVR